ncbi:hypothetical protein IQ07DRAFT_659786 [Pyrenochaeta sp. DS3sAY3a]|nr:hypothetical protein IQ07DRAFT_659786 [Pyrenochaeta sp. DS3sAY3a]
MLPVLLWLQLGGDIPIPDRWMQLLVKSGWSTTSAGKNGGMDDIESHITSEAIHEARSMTPMKGVHVGEVEDVEPERTPALIQEGRSTAPNKGVNVSKVNAESDKAPAPIHEKHSATPSGTCAQSTSGSNQG